MGIGADKRIGYSFIYSGIGYGGSCFPKDVKSIINTANELGYEMKVLKAVEEVNNAQKNKIYKKIKKYFTLRNDVLKNKCVAIWGLAFKPETDDIREASSIVTIKKLLEEGAIIHAHDPKAVNETKQFFKNNDNIKYFNNNYDCLEKADILVLITEWRIYRQPDFEKIKKLLKYPVIFDGRNQYNPEEIKKLGFEYFCIGRK